MNLHIMATLRRISGGFDAWGRALQAGAPAWLQPHLRLYGEVASVDIAGADVAPAFERVAGSCTQVEAWVSGHTVLRHDFIVPKAVAGELRRVVNLEAARVMPVDAQKLAFSFRVTGEAGEGRLGVTLLAVRQSLLDKIVVGAQKLGLEILAVRSGAAGDGAPFEFAVPSIRRRRLSRLLAVVGLSLLAGVLLNGAAGYYVSRVEDALADTDRQIILARKKTDRISSLQNRLQAMQSLAAAVHSERASQQLVELFDQLTANSPDNVVFEDLRIDGRNVVIRGRADAPEEWALALEGATAFEDVSLLSVRQAEGETVKQFELRLRALWPFERAQPE